jgi:hypothetical protein
MWCWACRPEFFGQQARKKPPLGGFSVLPVPTPAAQDGRPVPLGECGAGAPDQARQVAGLGWGFLPLDSFFLSLLPMVLLLE